MNFNDTVAKLWAKLLGWFEGFVLILPNLIVAAAVLVLFWLLAGQLKQLFQKIFRKLFRSDEVAWLASIVVYFAMLVAGLVVALGVLGLDKTVTSLLAGAGIVGLAIALAFQDLGQNILAGIYLSLRRTIKTGDLIETNGFFGTIRHINLRSLHLDMPTGQVVSIPNREVFQNAVRLFSTGQRRVDLSVGVSYGDDLEKVKAVTLAAVEAVQPRRADRSVEFFYEAFADSSVNFVVRFWIDFNAQGDFLRAQSDAIMNIRRAYNENNITIPFPIRTLDFGIVGGEKLSTSLRDARVERGTDNGEG